MRCSYTDDGGMAALLMSFIGYPNRVVSNYANIRDVVP